MSTGLKIPSKPIYDKIAGTTFEGRQAILAAAEKHQVEFLILEREPTNKFDHNAIKVMAPVVDKEGKVINKVQLGYVRNSDRMCITCAKMMDGGTFARSNTVKCPHCGTLSQCAKRGEFECPECQQTFMAEECRTVTCPTCFGDEWTRDGLASFLAPLMDAGVQFVCQVSRDKDTGRLQYTGGDTDPDTRRKRSRGCNITITPMEKTLPV